MELVVDTNVIFASFMKAGLTRKILIDRGLRLWIPEHGLNETKRVLTSHSIRKRLGGVSKTDILISLDDLTSTIEILPSSAYRPQLKLAKRLAPHYQDAPYIALALHLNIPVWTNDAGFKEQDRVTIYTTRELVKLLKK